MEVFCGCDEAAEWGSSYIEIGSRLGVVGVLELEEKCL